MYLFKSWRASYPRVAQESLKATARQESTPTNEFDLTRVFPKHIEKPALLTLKIQ